MPLLEEGALLDAALREQEARAQTCYRNLEFLVDWPGGKSGPPQFLLRGMLDCLWQDAEDHWHVLAFTADVVPAAEQDTYWQSRQVGLTLCAWVVQRKFGAWPRSVTLHFLRDGLALRKSGRQLPERKVVAAVTAALNEIAGLHLSD
jgi:hypothetical protein